MTHPRAFLAGLNLAGLALVCGTGQASAQDFDPYLGEIAFYASDFCPEDTLPADGRTLQVSQYQALYSLLGNTFGGDAAGKSFNLPDLRARKAVGIGQNPMGSGFALGAAGGSETQGLTIYQLPDHAHNFTGTAKGTITASSVSGDITTPTGALLGTADAITTYTRSTGSPVDMAGATAVLDGDFDTERAGQSAPVSVQDPFLALTACISVNGIFPSK